MDSNYWSSFTSRRINRRRALSATGGAALGAAFLAACGDDDDEPAPIAPTSATGATGSTGGGATGAARTGAGATGATGAASLVAPYEDESAGAVPGGVMVTGGASTSGSLDPHENGQTAAFAEIFNIYSTPLKWGKAVGRMPTPDTITGDAFESWEISPDGMSITLKLRPNHTFDPRPPTNGRAMTIEDVKWSWDRTVELSSVMAEVHNNSSETGPLLNLTTPDANTAVIDLAFPYGAITEMLSFWYFFLAPIENQDQMQTDPRGSGPFRMIMHEPDGRGIEYEKNESWYVPDRPFLDGMLKLSLDEYAAEQAQFEAGAVWAMNPTRTTRQEEVLRVKNDHPEMILRQKPTAYWSLPHHITWFFSQREDSPFVDQRLRQAVSMLYDREAYVETFYNVQAFSDAGLPMEIVSDTQLATQAFNWIDPRDPEFGENAKYLMYNPEEAAKLIEASGFTGTIPFANRDASPQPHFGVSAEILFGMMEAGGLSAEYVPADPQTQWLENKRGGWQVYTGMFQNTMQAYNDDLNLSTKYTPGGRNRYSAEPIRDMDITERINAMQQTLDPQERNQLIKAITRDLAALMFDMPQDYDQRPFILHHPWLKNYNTFATLGFSSEQNSSGKLQAEYWYDQTLHS